jgi:uncharacterized protein DUF4136
MKRLLIVLLLLCGCVTVNAQKVKVSANPREDLTRCKTYAWSTGMVFSNGLIKLLVIDAVDLEMARKGLKKVPDGAEADIVVVAWTSLDSNLYVDHPSWEPMLNTIDKGIPAGTYASSLSKGSLVIDMLDAKTKNGMWRGTASSILEHGPTIDPAHNAKTAEKPIKKAVHKMFKKFPNPK